MIYFIIIYFLLEEKTVHTINNANQHNLLWNLFEEHDRCYLDIKLEIQNIYCAIAEITKELDELQKGINEF